MGAYTYSLDIKLLKFFKKNLSSSIFIETGTYNGESCLNFKNYFESLYTFETDKKRYEIASEKFVNEKKINSYFLSGSLGIKKYHNDFIDKNCIYWLDAHETENVGKKTSDSCDILNEINAIKNLNCNSVIIIDDARLFLSPPPAPHNTNAWPSFIDIYKRLRLLSLDHSLLVLNDNIVFYPNNIKTNFIKFSQKNNKNLLHYSAELRNAYTDIDNIKKINDELHLQLVQKENTIYELSKSLEAYRTAFNSLKFLQILRIFRILKIILIKFDRFISIFKPKLGKLNQFKPKKINLPYSSKVLNKEFYKFSIVTPSFNQASFIESTIKSVLKQNYPALQYIVQDGMSTDHTKKILNKYKNLIDFEIKEDNGQADAINEGFAKTDGDIMAWINSDDIYLSNTFHFVNHLFKKNPQIDVIYGDRIIINESNDMVGRWIIPYHSSSVLKNVDYLPQESVFWRRSIWNKIGSKLDTSFNFALDWDLFTKFADVNAKFAHVNRYLAAFRFHEKQKTTNLIHTMGKKEMDIIRKKYKIKPLKKDVDLFIFLFFHVIFDFIIRTKDRMLNKKNIF